jgi:hypothetical protein
VAFDNSSATRRLAFEEETLGEWVIEITMTILREASQSRIKMCQIPPFLSPQHLCHRSVLDPTSLASCPDV